MPIMFNTILEAAGFSPHDVLLIRHQTNKAGKGQSAYILWRDNLAGFVNYQATQKSSKHMHFNARFWASFVCPPNGETLFVGIYRVNSYRVLKQEITNLVTNEPVPAYSCDLYDLTLEQNLSDLIGKVVIDWGPSGRSWVQRADRQDKRILEVRPNIVEPSFPGFMEFIAPLSKLDSLPNSWKQTLLSVKGIYLLTCPRTKEQYVGSAYGEKGFWGRWQEYVQTGHGGDIALKTRLLSDYQVSILEVAGSSASTDEILKMESKWKDKLQSREMGLNRN